MTLDDGTPPPPSFVDQLAALEPDQSGPMIAADGAILCFEPPTQAPGIPSFVLADGTRADDEATSGPVDAVEPTILLAHPRLIPRALLGARTRFPRASSPMAAPDPRVCLPKPSHAAEPITTPLPRRR